jgi:hypothetical protein
VEVEEEFTFTTEDTEGTEEDGRDFRSYEEELTQNSALY